MQPLIDRNDGAEPPALQDPVFILGAHKSGTSLLRSLLDGHPALSAFPSELHFFQYAGFWVDYALRRTPWHEWTWRQRVDGLRRFFAAENQDSDPYGASNMAGRYDSACFDGYFCGIETADLRSTFVRYCHAIHAALHGEQIPGDRRIVEKSVENAEFAPLLARLFPAAKFIHIVRNPYATALAIRHSRQKRGARRAGFVGPIIEALRNSYYHLLLNPLSIDAYHVIRYEDLAANTAEVMRGVAAFLNIDFGANLLQPTVLGVAWRGNSTSDRKFDGVTAARVDAWQETISDLEVNLLNRFVRPLNDRYAYATIPPRHHPARQLFAPIGGESAGDYVRNRCYYLANR